jgi:hypothetical protein
LAGHGVSYNKSQTDGSPRFFFCPFDADVSNITFADQVTEKNRLISLDDLYGQLSTCRAGSKLLFVDACRNDPNRSGETRAANSETLPKLPDPPGGTVAFFGCSANQKAVDPQNLGHGVFFNFVIEGLKGKADAETADHPKDGIIEISELQTYVFREVDEYVARHYPGQHQYPELRGDIRRGIPILSLERDTESIIRGQSFPKNQIENRFERKTFVGTFSPARLSSSAHLEPQLRPVFFRTWRSSATRS